MFKRDKYLNQLIRSRDNHQVKAITGIRRAGKSYLINEIFFDWLVENGVDVTHIIKFQGDKTYYVQVALTIDTLEKKDQEYESLRNIPDSFKKVIIVKNEGLHYRTSEGFLRLSLLDFLTNIDSLDW